MEAGNNGGNNKNNKEGIKEKRWLNHFHALLEIQLKREVKGQ